MQYSLVQGRNHCSWVLLTSLVLEPGNGVREPNATLQGDGFRGWGPGSALDQLPVERNDQTQNQETQVFGHCIHTLISVDTGTQRLDVCLVISGEN